MTDKQFDQLSEQEFDLYLEQIADNPPPAELSDEFTPWRRAMNRILWGTGLTTLTLNFLNLDVILPAIGLILLLLGYRALRHENSWFKTGYVISWIRILWWLIAFAIHTTVYSGENDIQSFLTAGTYFMIIPGFLLLLSLRNGIRGVQRKVGLSPHGGNGMLVWFLIIIVLALVGYSGISGWVLIIAYIFILRNLCKLSQELDEAGYSVSPAPVKLSDHAVKLSYAGIIALSLVIGYSFFGKYPMDWQPVTASSSREVQQIRQELLDLGFPWHILDDLTPEDILSCKGAVRVVVNVQDHPVNDGRQVTERRSDGRYTYTVYDQEELRLTGVGVELPGEREQWKIIHHFQWVIDPGFCGTEVIHLWPAFRNGQGWASYGDFSGQLLYDHDGKAFSAPYHSLGQETYTLDSIFWGKQTSTDVFAAFSMPNHGENHRGYVAYTIAEAEDGWLVDAWINYTHQTSRLQYPVITAKKKHLTSGVGDTRIFNTVQDALQFFPNDENLKPLS